jgi:hypothetical protein
MSLIRSVLLVSFMSISMTALAAPLPPAVRAACKADARRLCSHVLFKEEARRACMRQNRAKWSEGCKQAFANMILGKRGKKGR